MSDNPESEMLAQCAQFLKNRVEFFDHLDSLGAIAIAIAVGLLLIQGLAAIWAIATTSKTRAMLESRPRTHSLPGVGEIVKALPGVVNSLAKAPATVILIILGLLVVWLPDFAPSQACLDLTKEEQAEQSSTPEAITTETPSSTVTETTTKTTTNWKQAS
ncbi:hypothetical protein [uncultured Erythrobacter sp.]|uniref:hypothetical protein n=1 Tax=uncultured Erythrobacter sp. TaxID=263913 RepID=UPI002604A786|nr:hypothetical protein [uncultured Erythrobacter sp.]